MSHVNTRTSRRAKAVQIFGITVGSLVAIALLIFQSAAFAHFVKGVLQKHMPENLGLRGDFENLRVLMFPPGVAILKPSLVLEKKNVLNFPEGTKIESERIDVTFQLIQLMTGTVNIRSLAIIGANLHLDLDDSILFKHEKSVQKNANLNWWQSLVRFRFQSVSLLDSQIDLRTHEDNSKPKFLLKGFAKELTISKGTSREKPSYEIALELQNSIFEAPFLKMATNEVKASGEIQAEQIQIRDFSVQQGSSYLHTSGSILGNISHPEYLAASLAFIFRGNTADLAKITTLPPINGQFVVEGKFAGDLLKIRSTAKAGLTVEAEELTYDAWNFHKFRADAIWQDQRLQLSQIGAQIENGNIKASQILIDPFARLPLISASVQFTDVDFRKLMGRYIDKVFPIHMSINGQVDITQSTKNADQLRVEPNITVKQFSFDNQKPRLKKPYYKLFGVDEIAISGSADIGKSGVSFESIRGKTKNCDLRMTGDIEFNEGISLDIGGQVDLKDLGKLAAFDIAGKGGVHWTVNGIPGKDLELLFDVDLVEAYFLNLHLGAVKGLIVWDDQKDSVLLKNLKSKVGTMQLVGNGFVDLADNHDDVNIRVQVPQGNAQDFKTIMSEFILNSVPWYPDSLTGELTGNILASGKTSLDKLSVEGDMDFRHADFYGETFRSGKFHAGYRRGALIAENVEINKHAATIEGNISYSADKILNFNLTTKNMSTNDIDLLGAWGIPYSAPISLTAWGRGPIDRLDGALVGNIEGGAIRNAYASPSQVNLKSEAGRILGSVSLFGGQGTANIDFNTNPGQRSKIILKASPLDFRPILLALNSSLSNDELLEAKTSGAAQLEFELRELSKFSGKIDWDSLSLTKRGFHLQLSSPFHLSVESGTYAFEDFRVTGTDTDFTARGKVVRGDIDYDFGGKIGLGLIEFLTPEIPSFRGAWQLKGHLSGRADSPQFSCSGGITNADLRIAAIEQVFENVSASINWVDNAIKMNEGMARIGGGQITAKGDAILHLTRAPELDYQLELNSPKFKIYPFSSIRMFGHIHLKGTNLPYKVEGSATVAEGIIQENFASNDGGRQLRSSQFLPKSGGSNNEVQIFETDLAMSAERGLFVRNDLFDVETKGRVRVLGSIKSPKLLGSAEVLHGKLLFKDSAFNIQNAVVNFNNPSVLDPEFDLTGSTETKGYKVTLFASGKTTAPNVSFQSEPPLSQPDIVTLLTLGVTSSNLQSLRSQDRDAYRGNEAYSLLFNQSGINKGLNEKLGVKVGIDQAVMNSNNMDSAFRPNTDASVNVAPRVFLQKEVVKNLNARVGSTVGASDSRQQDMNLEYNLGRNASVLGVYEDQRGADPKNSRTSLGVDVKFRWNFK